MNWGQLWLRRIMFKSVEDPLSYITQVTGNTVNTVSFQGEFY